MDEIGGHATGSEVSRKTSPIFSFNSIASMTISGGYYSMIQQRNARQLTSNANKVSVKTANESLVNADATEATGIAIAEVVECRGFTSGKASPIPMLDIKASPTSCPNDQELVKPQNALCIEHETRTASDCDVDKAMAETSPEACSPKECRSYGLPPEMEGKRSHIWELIFEKVDDFESIISLREVCFMFMALLERKYIATMLPSVVGNRFGNVSTRWEGGRQDWLKTLTGLRTLSKITKKSVDSILNEGMIGKEGTNWFSTKSPHYLIRNETLIWELGASQEGQRRLRETLQKLKNENISPIMISLVIDEGYEFRVAADLPTLRESFEEVIEKIGHRIVSFRYRTEERAFETYVNLRLTFMPNLRDLIVELTGRTPLRPWEISGRITVEPFTICPRLKRYLEGPKGFGVPFLREILRANPTIQEVMLGETSYNEWENIKQALDSLQLIKFHSLCMPQNVFFERRFYLVMQLTTLALWDPKDRFLSTSFDVKSLKLFNFILCCKNLEDLLVATPHVRDTGGYLKVPKLKHVVWKLFPTFKTLEFLQPVTSLQELDLDVSECPDIKRKENILQFLRKWNVLNSFPKLKRVRGRTQNDGQFMTIWTK